MKRIISLILVACLVLSLLAGISFSVFAEPAGLAFTGLGTLTPGNFADPTGISGAPEGFYQYACLEKYDYESGWFMELNGNPIDNNGVYRLTIVIYAEGDAAMTWDEAAICDYATIDGKPFDNISVQNCDDDFVYEVAFYKVFLVGQITLLDTVSFDALPAVQAGTPTDLSGITLSEGSHCRVSDASYWYSEYDKEVGTVLEDGDVYHLVLNLKPEEGYWFDYNLRCSAPVPTVAAFTEYCWGNGTVDFRYSLSQEITWLEINADAAPTFGAPVQLPEITCETDADTELDIIAHWSREHEDGWHEIEGGIFDLYGTYGLFITVQPKGATTFQEPVEVLFNDIPVFLTENAEIWSSSEQHVTLFVRYTIDPPNGFIDYVQLIGGPDKIEPGQSVTVPDIYAVDTPCFINEINWVDAHHNPVTSTFEDGKDYYLHINLEAYDGYAFNNHCYADIELTDGTYDGMEFYCDGGATTDIYFEYSLKPTVSEVDVQVTVPQLGAAPAAPTAPEGALYTVQDYHWSDWDSGNEVEKFEAGKKYCLEIRVVLAEGYRTDDHVIATCNGQDPLSAGWSKDEVFITQTFSFKTVIDRVDVTMPIPQLGDTADQITITTPADAPYQYNDDMSWYGEATEFDGTFGKDMYHMTAGIMPMPGYEFTEDTKFYINGELCDDFYVYDSDDFAEVSYSISFREKITKVEFPALPTVNVGDYSFPPQVQAPAGAHYTLEAIWAISTGSYAIEPIFGEPFANNNAYYLVLMAEPAQGYEFAEDLVITVGGQDADGMTVINASLVEFAKLYSFGLPVIDTVDIIVPTLRDGQTPGELTTPENAPYSIVGEVDWGVSDSFSEDIWGVGTVEPGDTFISGKHYWVSGLLQAAEGYVFADTLTVRVNGIPGVDPTLLGLPGALGDMSLFIGYAGQATGAQPDTPANGDIDGNGNVTTEDVIQLLLHVTMPDMFTINVNADYTGDGLVTTEDVIQLLLHVTMPDMFPL
jgi:hypothetical protein